MARKKKKGLLVLLGLGGLAGVALLLVSRDAKAQPPDDDDDDDDDGDDDDFTDVSPGIPQPPSAPVPVSPPIQIPVPPPVFAPPAIPSPRQPAPPVPAPPPQESGPPVIEVPIPDIVRDVPGVPPGDVITVELPPNLGGVDIPTPPRQAPRPAPRPAPPVTVPIPVVAPVPDDTRELVTALLAQERAPRWKRIEPAVKNWQRSRGLTQDGKFGPKSAIVVAAEVGTVPIVRFWPTATGTNPRAALDDYRNALLTIAASKGGLHASQLQRSAAREKGQAFGPPTGDGGARPVLEGF